MKTNHRIHLGRRIIAALCLAGLALGLSGCSLFRLKSSPPKAEVAPLQLATNAAPSATLTVMQLQVMRFADSYVAQIAQAADDFAARVGTPQARLAALRWKLNQATAAYTDATGENPVVNALDMLVLVTVSRMVIEDYGVDAYGQAILPELEIQRQLETNIWTMANVMLKPQQQQELRTLIQEWRAKNPHLRYVGSVRFREFVSAIGMSAQQSRSSPNSIFSLLYLDPFSGLDPTAAAIEETRALGERAMYYTQRMPQLLSWQAEVLAYQLAAQPESVQVLSNANQLSASAASFAQTAQQLPQLINDQRQAAIQQLLDGLRSQETDVRLTLDAGAEAATAINDAIVSLDQFVRFVSAPNTNRTASATNSRPFNVLDYGAAAGQIGAAAKDLNNLLNTVNLSAPQLAKLGQQTTADAKQVVDHAYRRGLELILVLLGGSLLTGLIYRMIANKPTAGRPKPAGPEST
ncbi:MAG TPA: hypothetical protein VMB80_18215 [Candidatus Acidoferrum sp.]|nr:hypothetical protein [Candidatus Acidoferrum sp.]